MDKNIDTIVKIIKLGRPQYLAGDFLLFLMGSLLAVLLNAEFVLSKFILGYSILLIAHLAVHYSNDYFDFEVDSYTGSSLITGGSGILVENPELRDFSKKFSLFLMGLSIFLAAAFTILFHYPVTFFLFLLFGNLLAWYYTAPPIKLVYRRLGEVANIIAVIIFLGTGYFALMGTLDITFIIFSIPIIFFQIIFINSFELPTLEGDKLGNKITWIVSKGREFGFKLNVVCGMLATLSFIIIPYTKLFPSDIDFRVLVLISLISLILGIYPLFRRRFDREFTINFVKINVAALFIMSLLIDVYFIYLII
jgi:1,4-dihydroxy-2-naphthoate octaprenyltransferase